MLKKTITYEDFDGRKVTEDFYFNLTQAELLEFEASLPGGLEKTLENLVQSEDGSGMLKLFKDAIGRSYGEKHDGRFIKSPEITSAFLSTEAYSELLLSMASNADVATGFFNGIMPKSLLQKAKAAQEQAQPPTVVSTSISEPEKNDISGMSVDELRAELERRAREA